MSISLGQQEYQATPVPYIPLFQNPLRTLAGAEPGAVSAVPAAERIDLSKSRFGVENTISLLVKGNASGVKIELWARVPGGSDYFYVNEATTTKALQLIQFFNLPALEYIPYVATPQAPTVISGGGTK